MTRRREEKKKAPNQSNDILSEISHLTKLDVHTFDETINYIKTFYATNTTFVKVKNMF